MEVQLHNQELVAIEYPGTVVNVKNLMKQLGSEKKVTSTFNDPKKRLELSFRPEDPFSKPAYGDRCFTTSMLIEVVRKRKKNSNEVKLEVRFLGNVKSIYKFKAMVDFQKLPIHINAPGTDPESLLPLIMPKDLQPASWLNEECPLYVAPLFFSRFDYPQSGYMEILPKTSHKTNKHPQFSLKSHARNTRASYAIMTSFDNPVVATEPKKEALDLLKSNHLHVDLKKRLDILFEERPIWIKSGLLSRLNCDKVHLRYALGCTAYYFSSGPWRTLWIKFGYDPRKDPKSKIYQTMDFRINPAIKIGETGNRVKRKVFDYHTIPIKSQKTNLRIPLLNTEHLVATSSKDINDQTASCSTADTSEEMPSYVFIPGRIPQFRQCYFQLCDVHLDEVQELIHQNDGREHFCHERDGWCDVGILDKCREIISLHIKEIAQKDQQDKTDLD